MIVMGGIWKDDNLKKDEMNFASKSQQAKTPSQIIKIEGVGIAEVYGTWNVEKLIRRLLESESITK